MNKTVYIFLLALFFVASVKAQSIKFKNYFEKSTLRFDYIHTGNFESDIISVEAFIHEPFWAGSKKNLISPFDFGKYKIVLADKKTKQIIFSNGYSTLFAEWQATENAKSNYKSFYENVVMPFPKKESVIKILSFNNNKWDTIFSTNFNPTDYNIKKDQSTKYRVIQINGNKKPANALDILFIPEGYTSNQMNKFISDSEKMKDLLLSFYPFNKHSKSINIRLVLAPSIDEGTDYPGNNIWKNTLVNTSFYTFGIERYLGTTDMKTIRDIASNTYYDQIYILVNSDKYGGGAIYNFYNLCTVDNEYSKEIFMHELGHGLAWLADEYFYDDEFQDIYNKKIEPREVNITTLVDFDKKWKNKLLPNTPIPTLITENNYEDIGVYEGGGYSSKGIYRAYQNCKMKSNNSKEFCGVCKNALQEIIEYYCD